MPACRKKKDMWEKGMRSLHLVFCYNQYWNFIALSKKKKHWKQLKKEK